MIKSHIFRILFALFLSALVFIYCVGYAGFVVQSEPTGASFRFESKSDDGQLRTPLKKVLGKKIDLISKEETAGYWHYETHYSSVSLHGGDNDNAIFITTNNESSLEWIRIAEIIENNLLENEINVQGIYFQRNPKTYKCDYYNPCDFKVSGVAQIRKHLHTNN